MLKSPFLAFLFCTIFLGAFLVVALFFGDSHLVNRGGALLSALAAIMVFLQLTREDEMDSLESSAKEAVATANGPQGRILKRKVQIANEQLNGERHSLLKSVTIVLFVGEIIHGWGDYVYYAIKGLLQI